MMADLKRWSAGRLAQLSSRINGSPMPDVAPLGTKGRVFVGVFIFFCIGIFGPKQPARVDASASTSGDSTASAPLDAAGTRRQAYVDSLNQEVATTGPSPLHFDLVSGMPNVLEITGHGLESGEASKIFRGYLRKGFPLDTTRMRELSFIAGRIHFADGAVGEWAFGPRTKRARILEPAGTEAAAGTAQAPTEVDGGPGRAIRGGFIVWRDEEASKKGGALLANGVRDPELIGPYVACMTSAGDRAAVTDGGFFSQTVIIVAGRDKGCQGIVPVEAWVSSQNQ